MAVTISFFPDPAGAGDEVCVTATGTPGQGQPTVNISIDGAPSTSPTPTADTPANVTTVCFHIPLGTSNIYVTAGQASCTASQFIFPS